MSKTSQRKRSHEQQGYKDGYNGIPFQYASSDLDSPNLAAYKRGYKRGAEERLEFKKTHVPIKGYDNV